MKWHKFFGACCEKPNKCLSRGAWDEKVNISNSQYLNHTMGIKSITCHSSYFSATVQSAMRSCLCVFYREKQFSLILTKNSATFIRLNWRTYCECLKIWQLTCAKASYASSFGVPNDRFLSTYREEIRKALHWEWQWDNRRSMASGMEENLLIKRDMHTVLTAGKWCSPMEWVWVSHGIKLSSI